MDITSIIIRKLTPENKMKAIVSITFDDSLVVHDVKIIDGANGLFIAMPSRRIQDGEFKDIVHPIHSAFREILSVAVLDKYYEALEKFEKTQLFREERSKNTEPQSEHGAHDSEANQEEGQTSEERLSFSSSLI